MGEQIKRCRINFSQTSKGTVQRDVTGEAETSEESAKLLNEGLDKLAEAVHSRNLKFVDEV
jgi:hypothetical protein